ncbi:hypothetical protein GCM10028833_09840 [Glycomyces tarimensis]
MLALVSPSAVTVGIGAVAVTRVGLSPSSTVCSWSARAAGEIAENCVLIPSLVRRIVRRSRTAPMEVQTLSAAVPSVVPHRSRYLMRIVPMVVAPVAARTWPILRSSSGLCCSFGFEFLPFERYSVTAPPASVTVL